jgi:hypothetical protein
VRFLDEKFDEAEYEDSFYSFLDVSQAIYKSDGHTQKCGEEKRARSTPLADESTRCGGEDSLKRVGRIQDGGNPITGNKRERRHADPNLRPRRREGMERGVLSRRTSKSNPPQSLDVQSE